MLRCVELAFLMAVFQGASGPSAISQDARIQAWASLDRQAEGLYGEGDLNEAIRIARLAVAAASDSKQSGHSLDRLGFFEFTSGNLKDGESFLRQSLELRKRETGDARHDLRQLHQGRVPDGVEDALEIAHFLGRLHQRVR